MNSYEDEYEIELDSLSSRIQESIETCCKAIASNKAVKSRIQTALVKSEYPELINCNHRVWSVCNYKIEVDPRGATRPVLFVSVDNCYEQVATFVSESQANKFCDYMDYFMSVISSRHRL